MQSWPSLTAEVVCLARALEAQRRSPLVTDPLAREFLRRPLRTGPLPPLAPEFVTSIAARHAWIDEQLVALLPQVEQLLILGAGYDTRCWRLDVPRTTVEIDHPATAARKGRRVRELGLESRTTIAVDLSTTPLPDALRAGHLKRAPTAIVWEGVSMYLTPQSIRATLDALEAVLGPECHILMDLWVRPDQPSLRGAAESLAARHLAWIGEPIRSRLRTAHWDELFARASWRCQAESTVRDVAGAADRTARLGLRLVRLAPHPQAA